MQYVVDKKWKWVECNLVIKRLPQKNYHEGVYESLQAEVELMSDEADIRNFESQIIMEKSFQFEQGRGFIWHKSWYIPQIVLKLSPKVTKMLKQENHIKKINCEMLSGYPFKKDEHFYLQQVKLDGDTLRQFNKKGQVTFSNVKFSQTSFNKNKNRFSIILVIYTSYKENERSIIKSYISSPIHVDSRKWARKKISANTFIQDEININKFLTKLQGAQKLVNQNHPYQQLLTIYGFIKYYTAANIRFKIKHPYYIGYHFHDVFDVYYNSQQAKDPTDVLEIIYENQRKQNQKVKSKPKEKKDIFNDNKEILKKSSPKILLFLIKNAPKQCFLIKDELVQSQQKIQLPSENLAPINQQLQKFDQKNQDNQKIIEKPYQLARLQQENEHRQNLVENGQDPIKSCLVHIIQPYTNRPQNTVNEKNQQEEEEKEVDQQNINETSKLVKQQQNSEFGVEFLSKNGQLEANQQSKKQQKKNQLLKQEEAIKKIYSIFESWKFNFVHLKKSDGGLTVINKKWILIPQEELLQSFQNYTKKKAALTPQNNKSAHDQGNVGQTNGTNANSYLTYDIHQVIVLQKGKKSTVKIQENIPQGNS